MNQNRRCKKYESSGQSRLNGATISLGGESKVLKKSMDLLDDARMKAKKSALNLKNLGHDVVSKGILEEIVEKIEWYKEAIGKRMEDISKKTGLDRYARKKA